MLENIFKFDDEEPNDNVAYGTVRILEPRNFLDCYTAAELLKSDEILVINIEKVGPGYKQRYLDFVSGVVMAIDGKIRKVDKDIVICVPPKFKMEEKKDEQ